LRDIEKELIKVKDGEIILDVFFKFLKYDNELFSDINILKPLERQAKLKKLNKIEKL
jgi:hypothetical protein